MENIRRVQLSEIAEFITKGTTPTTLGYEFQEEGVNFLKIECFDENGDFVESKATHISNECHERLKRSQLKSGDILFSIAGVIGRVASVTEDMLPANTNQALAIIRISDEQVYLPYVKLILTSPIVIGQFERKKQGVAQLNLSLKDINELSIPLPSKKKQIEIAELFAKIINVISKRKEELKALDDLIKARFVEMFGDPIQNPKGYLKETINKHIDLLSGYPFKSEQYVDEGINICGGLIIMPQKIKWDECVHWSTVDGFEDYLLEENDIVMALDRPWISEGFKIAKVDAEHLPALLIQRTARIRAVDMNQDYLYHCFINGCFDKHSNVTGSLVPHISAKDIRSFEVMIPPIELQERFATFVEEVDKSKIVVQKALDEAQLLFDSLMQEYFG